MVNGVWLDLLMSNEMKVMKIMKDTTKRVIGYSCMARNKVIACVYILMHQLPVLVI